VGSGSQNPLLATTGGPKEARPPRPGTTSGLSLVQPYRDPCWPKNPRRPRLRRFRPVRTIHAQSSLLLTVTVYLLILAIYPLHLLTLAMARGPLTPRVCFLQGHY